MKEILKEFRKFWLNKIKIHGSITSKDCEQFLSKAITKTEKRGREEVIEKIEEWFRFKDFKYGSIQRIDGYIDAYKEIIKILK